MAQATFRLISAAARFPYLPFRAIEQMLLGRRQPLHGHPRDVGLPSEDVAFPSADGVPLRGWFLPQEGARERRPTVVFVHGWPWNRLGNRAGGMPFPDRSVQFLVPAKALHAAGFQVLLFDLRNHGESGAALPVTNGLNEARDLIGAVRMLRQRPDVDGDRVGVIGTSMGGNTALYGIPDCQPIRAAVLVQPTHLGVFMANFARRELGPLGRAIARTITPLFHLVGAPPPSAHDMVAAARRLGDTVVRYIQGTGDPWGTLEDVKAMAGATPRCESVRLYPSTDRYGGYLYLETDTAEVVSFFAQHLMEQPVAAPQARSGT
jgi:pimeloyl-ACP methyl ester carboxylesterase